MIYVNRAELQPAFLVLAHAADLLSFTRYENVTLISYPKEKWKRDISLFNISFCTY